MAFIEIKPPTIEHKGVTYIAQRAGIESAFLGYEDHGLFAWRLDLFGEEDGSLSTGYHAFGDVPNNVSILQILLLIFKCNRWDDLPGKQAYLLRKPGDGWAVAGFVNLDQTQILIFDDFYESSKS